MDYTKSYWLEYQERDASPMGKTLTNARIEFVKQFYQGTVLDIGIGGGRFVKEIDGKGYDVCEDAIAWLESKNRYQNPYEVYPEAITCWDSLEHIVEAQNLISKVGDWVFVSMPIYEDVNDILQSKHYKPGEHVWYFTEQGLIDWFNELGFAVVGFSDIETVLGREGIFTYAFKRVE